MKFIDLIKETIWSLSGNKIRSALTILGIVIGVGSVIAMVSIGDGAKASIESSIESIGSNMLIVQPGVQSGTSVSGGRGSAQTLTKADAETIKDEISGIKALSADTNGRYQITAKGNNTNTQVIGTTPDYATVRNVNMVAGNFFSETQLNSMTKVAVIGPSVKDDLFGEDTDDSSAIGQTIKINKIEFKIIGITEEKGGSGFSNTDEMIYVPLTVMQKQLSGTSYVSTISISCADESQMTQIQNQITQLLLAKHKISDEANADFSITNQADIVSTASSVTGTLTVLLACIGGISLLVGGIGIMNMMLTSVTERTREIGLRKSIGAKKGDITKQFLAESILLTFIGGAVGILLGWIASLIVKEASSINTVVSLYSVFLAVGVSGLVGIVFGYYPARQAANLNPIDALRYE